MPEMTGTRVIEQDGGFVAVALLDDGTLSTPMSAPVRRSSLEAEWDRGFVQMTDSGPIYETSFLASCAGECCGNCCSSNCDCF